MSAPTTTTATTTTHTEVAPVATHHKDDKHHHDAKALSSDPAQDPANVAKHHEHKETKDEKKEKRIVCVFGATGNQGHSVVNHLLKNKNHNWKVRAFTRDSKKELSKEIDKKGAELYEGNMENEADIKRFLEGAYAVFANTDSASLGAKEYDVAVKIAEAAKAAGVKHYLWSTLPNIGAISKGKYDVPFFTNKARVDERIKQLDLPTTFLVPAYFYQNISENWQPHHKEDGTIVYNLPIARERMIPMFDVHQIGGPAVYALDHPQEWIGKYMNIVGEYAPIDYYMENLTNHTGRRVEYNYVPADKYHNNVPFLKAVADMFLYTDEFGYYPDHENMKQGRNIYPALRTWRDFLHHHPHYLKTEKQKHHDKHHHRHHDKKHAKHDDKHPTHTTTTTTAVHTDPHHTTTTAAPVTTTTTHH